LLSQFKFYFDKKYLRHACAQVVYKLTKTHHPAFFLADGEPVYANSQTHCSCVVVNKEYMPKMWVHYI